MESLPEFYRMITAVIITNEPDRIGIKLRSPLLNKIPVILVVDDIEKFSNLKQNNVLIIPSKSRNYAYLRNLGGLFC